MTRASKITFWTTTALMSFGMTASGLQQIMHTQAMVDLLAHIGYPTYFLYLIGTWKILAVIAVLVPGFKLLKEWAYAGLFFAMTGALFSHLACGDGFKELIGPAMQTVFIVLSWYNRPPSRRIIVTA
jgi:uncharacterized membrane protein